MMSLPHLCKEGLMAAIATILPNAEDLIELEPEELAGFLLEHLNTASPNGYVQLSRQTVGLFLAKPYPKEYRQKVAEALTVAWSWLEREGLVAPTPGNAFNEHFISKRGRSLK